MPTELRCLRRCNEQLAEKFEVIGHRPHLNRRSPVWTPTWLRNPSFVRNAFGQWAQWNSRICKCVRTCFFRSFLRQNDRWHIWQVYASGFACTFKWRSNFPLSTNAAGHWVHCSGLQMIEKWMVETLTVYVYVCVSFWKVSKQNLFCHFSYLSCIYIFFVIILLLIRNNKVQFYLLNLYWLTKFV